jgi:hypothetical protein
MNNVETTTPSTTEDRYVDNGLARLTRKITSDGSKVKENFGKRDLELVKFLLRKKLDSETCCLILYSLYLNLKFRLSFQVLYDDCKKRKVSTATNWEREILKEISKEKKVLEVAEKQEF